uniref:Core-binding (CB) domain-containing protein n=1 Tax=Meiothermus ruber TaxID=277 RepID=A0A7C3DNX7_MEIRU
MRSPRSERTGSWASYRSLCSRQPSSSNRHLLNSVRAAIRVRHLARSTEQSYLYYITDFIRFHRKKHPKDMGVEEVRAYLTDLAVNQNVSASTQNVASCLDLMSRNSMKSSASA